MYIRGTENHYRPISIGLSPRPLPMPDTKLRCIVLLCQSSSCAQLFATSWAAACQAPPSMGFSKQEYWSGLPFPSLGDLPNPGMESRSPTWQADSLPFEPSQWFLDNSKWHQLLCHFFLVSRPDSPLRDSGGVICLGGDDLQPFLLSPAGLQVLY